jgi:aryl-alcohol dehydrogenase-like predicted oxidoreductase
MHLRPLGRTGLEISEIGYGAWGIGQSMWIGAEDADSVQALEARSTSG